MDCLLSINFRRVLFPWCLQSNSTVMGFFAEQCFLFCEKLEVDAGAAKEKTPIWKSG
jgi:hypothetical protein